MFLCIFHISYWAEGQNVILLVTRHIYRNIPNYIYIKILNIDVTLTDFGVTRYNSALLCTVFFRILYENFFRSVIIIIIIISLVVKWIIAVIINRTEKNCFLIKRYIIYVKSFCIWIITLIEINAVMLLWWTLSKRGNEVMRLHL